MKTIPLTRGMFALVDDSDYDELSKHKWHAWESKGHGLFYARRNTARAKMRQSTVLMHQQIFGVLGGIHIDHCDRNGLNNQRSNLRACTAGQNAFNRKMRSDNKAGYKGISFKRSANKYVARIQFAGRRKDIGQFATAIEAAKAYDSSALKYFGEFARLNFA